MIDADKIVIKKETATAEVIEEQAIKELAKAQPALDSANEAVSKLEKKYIAEIKAMNNPPKDVATVMAAVMVLFRKPKDWVNVKKELNDP